MTTSRASSFLTEILSGQPIPVRKLAYFRAQLRYELHRLVLDEFLKQKDQQEITKADLARRLGRKPSWISRSLGAPGNWTIDTVSDLLLGMKAQPVFSVLPIKDRLAEEHEESFGDSSNSVSAEALEEMPVDLDLAVD
jgi:hypothetical protein